MKTQYCNHIKPSKSWQEADAEEAAKKDTTPFHVVVSDCKTLRGGKRLPFIISSFKPKKNGKSKFHEFDLSQETDKIIF